MGKWEMSKYTVEQLNNDYKSGRITVPKYQRGAVWNKKQKEKLIDSMNKGYPFGSILLYQNDGKRQIIDGLQRSTTIIEFVKNPARYFTDDNINDEIVNKIIDLGKNAIYLPSLEECASYLKENVKKDDIVLTLGAGTVTNIGPMIVEKR